MCKPFKMTTKQEWRRCPKVSCTSSFSNTNVPEKSQHFHTFELRSSFKVLKSPNLDVKIVQERPKGRIVLLLQHWLVGVCTCMFDACLHQIVMSTGPVSADGFGRMPLVEMQWNSWWTNTWESLWSEGVGPAPETSAFLSSESSVSPN